MPITNMMAKVPRHKKHILSGCISINLGIIWRVFSGEREGRNSGGNVQSIRSTIGRHKIDRERSKMV